VEGFRIDGSGWRGRFFFSFFFFLTTYWASFLSTLIHEVLGHGLVAMLEGLSFHGFIVTLTEGMTFVTTSGTPLTDAMILAAGIVVQFLFGLVVFLVSFRLRGFTSKIVTLIFATLSMMNSSSYLLIGSIMKLGDPPLISSYANVPLEALAFLGIVLLAAVGVTTFPQIVKVLQDFLMFKSKRDAYVSVVLVFIFGSFPLFLLTTLMSGSASPLVTFLSIVLLVSTFMAFIVRRYKLPDVSVIQQKFVSWRGIGINLLLVIVSTTVWLGVFGYAIQTAHGLVWYEFGPIGVANVKVTIQGNLTARVETRFRPAFSVSISENLWFNVRNSPNWNIYIEEARRMVTNMFNTASFEFVATKADNADIWYSGIWHGGGARAVVVDINLNQSLNMQRSDNRVILRVNDPWAPRGYLDSFNLTYTGLRMINYLYRPMTAFDKTAGGMNEGYLLWMSKTSQEAPDAYIFTLVKE